MVIVPRPVCNMDPKGFSFFTLVENDDPELHATTVCYGIVWYSAALSSRQGNPENCNVE
jgi:hypothetical protein